MSEPHDPEEGALLRRLREGAGGDGAARLLRRRYDDLRADYEGLLTRLGQLEARLSEPAPPAAVPELAQSNGLTSALLGPLLTLRDQYAEALGGLQTIVASLEGLAAGAFKAQRGADDRSPVSTREPQRSYQVEARARDTGTLLAFQEGLRSLPGVARVAIHAIDAERATFVVELG